MPFDDARPEIHFDNLHEINSSAFDDLNISEPDDYMHAVDFEIPEPIVELKEYDGLPQNSVLNSNNAACGLQNFKYKVVMQEVPIEF